MDASEGVKASSMQAAILAFGVVSLPLLLVTFVMGYGVHYGWWDIGVSIHLKIGLITTILTMLTHTTTMFYFMGTGSAIKAEVRERNLDVSYLRRARAFKGSFFLDISIEVKYIHAGWRIPWTHKKRTTCRKVTQAPTHCDFRRVAKRPGGQDSSYINVWSYVAKNRERTFLLRDAYVVHIPEPDPCKPLYPESPAEVRNGFDTLLREDFEIFIASENNYESII